MKCLQIVLLALAIGSGAGICSEKGMPIKLCVPAVEMAMKLFQDSDEQNEFLRGFRNGVESELAEPGYLGKYITSEPTKPYQFGQRAGAEAVSPEGKWRRVVSLSDLGYSQMDWKEVAINCGLEEGYSFELPDSKDVVYCRFAPWVWEKWKPRFESFEVIGGGKKIWVKGWLSPVGGYGHMAYAKRRMLVTELYRKEAPSPK